MRARLQALGLVAIALVAAAFILSFVDGVLGGRAPDDGVMAEDPPVDTTLPPDEAARIRVEVLNGAGRAGLARRATDQLRATGFDVVYFGNAREFGREETVVLDRVGDPDAARAVAAALGAGVIETRPDSTLHLEVTVVLGQDWPPPDSAGSEDTDLRRGRIWRRLFGR